MYIIIHVLDHTCISPSLSCLLFSALQSPLHPLSTLSSLAVECQHKKDGGIGSDYVILWYYDMTSRSCRRFWYGGQGGNGNRFESKQECDDMCVHRVVVTSPPTTTVTVKTMTSPSSTLPETTVTPSEAGTQYRGAVRTLRFLPVFIFILLIFKFDFRFCFYLSQYLFSYATLFCTFII